MVSARHRQLGSRLAIKDLPPEVATSAVRLARCKREAALAANLSHPHIVPVFEFDVQHGMAYPCQASGTHTTELDRPRDKKKTGV